MKFLQQNLSKFLLILIYWLSIESILVNGCSQFLSSSRTQLHIPDGEQCELTFIQEDLFLIEDYLIEGVMKIEDTKDFNLRYNKLEFGEKGELWIGMRKQIQHFYIIFESKNQHCSINDTPPKGKLRINSLKHQHFDLIQQRNRSSLTLNQSPEGIDATSTITIIDFSEEQFTERTFDAHSSDLDTVILQFPLQKKITIFDEEILPKPKILVRLNNLVGVAFKKQKSQHFLLIIISKKLNDISKTLLHLSSLSEIQIVVVQLKNSMSTSDNLKQSLLFPYLPLFLFKIFFKYITSLCLAANIETLQGVRFINSQNIRLQGGKIAYSIFEAENRDEIQEFQIQSRFENNILFTGKYRLSLGNEATFKENIILKSPYFQLTPGQSHLSSNIFVASHCEFSIKQTEAIELNDNVFHNSSINLATQFHSEIRIYRVYLINSHISVHQQDIRTLVLEEVRMLNAFFSFEDSYLNESLAIHNSYIYANKNNQRKCIFGFQQYLNLKVLLNNNKIILENHFLFSQSELRKLNLLDYLHQTTGFASNFEISLFDNIIQRPQDIPRRRPLFDLPNMEILLISPPSKYVLIEMMNYNLSPLSFSSFLFFTPEERQFTTENPTYYQISSPKFYEEEDTGPNEHCTILKRNNDFLNSTCTEEYMQIMSQHVHQVNFVTRGLKPLHLKSFTINLRNPHLLKSQESEYSTYFAFSERPLLKIKLIKIHSNNILVKEQSDIIDSVSLEGITFRITYQNYLQITWTNQIANSMFIFIQVELCDVFQYIQKKRCINECAHPIWYYQCLEGQAEDNSVVQCGFGCLQCDSSPPHKCNQCDKPFYLSEGVCLDQCQSDYFPHEGICEYCLNGGEICQVRSGCYSCYSKNSGDCQDGQFWQEGQCRQCHLACQLCYGKTEYECSGCNEGYSLQFGKCLI